ncbi:MAG: ABC transporter ATP-binding protein [Mogibacterium sp.]|nr:ABC transporter ATP-binding protein [Mogibacterium sp.]
MIIVKDLYKKYEKKPALVGMDLTVPTASIYGMVGTNGAGKTTAIKHLAGVLRQDSGTIEFDGEDIWENELLKERIAIIPDDLYFPQGYRMKDMGRFYSGLYSRWNEERFLSMIGTFKLNPLAKIKSFSKGMKKQAAFCLAMSTMPDFLLLDEPIDGLDPIVRKHVWRYIVDDVADRQMSVLVSSHNLKEMEGICDRIGILHNGKTVLERDMESLRGDLHKVQVSFGSGDAVLKTKKRNEPYEGLNILHKESRGTVDLLLVGNTQEEIKNIIGSQEPLVFDMLPLTLEEVFIHELGGEDNAIKELLF